jgi:hypothetical protein
VPISKLKPSFCKIITKKLSLSLLRFSGQSGILDQGESIPKECRSAECRGSKKLAPFSGDFSVEQNSSEFAQFLRIKRQSSSQPAKKENVPLPLSNFRSILLKLSKFVEF